MDVLGMSETDWTLILVVVARHAQGATGQEARLTAEGFSVCRSIRAPLVETGLVHARQKGN